MSEMDRRQFLALLAAVPLAAAVWSDPRRVIWSDPWQVITKTVAADSETVVYRVSLSRPEWANKKVLDGSVLVSPHDTAHERRIALLPAKFENLRLSMWQYADDHGMASDAFRVQLDTLLQPYLMGALS